MEILFKQINTDAVFNDLAIGDCYLKRLRGEFDAKNTHSRIHHHNGFEIHFIDDGHQEYEIDNKTYNIDKGYFLLIPPLVKHRSYTYTSVKTKYSITFKTDDESPFNDIKNIVVAKSDERINNNLFVINAEIKENDLFSRQIVSNCIYDILANLLRISGLKVRNKVSFCNNSSNEIVEIAKQYITDNIEFNITVNDIAKYCCISTKQITRLFKAALNITPYAFIKQQKAEHIENLLIKGVSLKEVSEIMNFSSEYHFNTFFKKYSGLPPGKFSKMYNN